MPYAVVAVAGALLLRAGLTAALSGIADLRLVAVVPSAAEADPVVDRAVPDAVLVDHELVDDSGLAYGTRLRRRLPALGVVLLAPQDDGLVLRALDAGISGYVPRSAPIEAVLAALRHAAVAPSSFTAPDLAGALARYPGPEAALSPREVEVLALAADGLSGRAIAVRLGVGESTVKTYLARAYEKLGARTRTEALRAFRTPR